MVQHVPGPHHVLSNRPLGSLLFVHDKYNTLQVRPYVTSGTHTWRREGALWCRWAVYRGERRWVKGAADRRTGMRRGYCEKNIGTTIRPCNLLLQPVPESSRKLRINGVVDLSQCTDKILQNWTISICKEYRNTNAKKGKCLKCLKPQQCFQKC